MKVYQNIAIAFNVAWDSENADNVYAAEERIRKLVKWYLPNGNGFNAGCKLLDESTPEKLVFNADFNHIGSNGVYVGWSEHKVIVKPCFALGFTIKVTGRDRNEVKSYIAETFTHLLDVNV